MKTSAFQIAAVALLALAAGCYSIESAALGTGASSAFKVRAAGGKPAEHIVVSNNGWYLFNIWPIVCGNAAPDARMPWVFFRDDVQEALLQDRLTAYARRHGYDVEEMNLFSSEQVMFTIPGVSFPVIPYLASYRRQQFSGVLVKRPAPPPPDPHARHRAEIAAEVNRLLNSIPDGGAK